MDSVVKDIFGKQETSSSYTDEMCFGVCHDTVIIGKSHRFLNSAETIITSGHTILSPFQAVCLPTEIDINSPELTKETGAESL